MARLILSYCAADTGRWRAKVDALILSAKTTLRERWKQVQSEIGNSSLFLATVDENIASNSIEEMSELDITLVVPEKLRKSEFTDYKRHPNVIDFKTFFVDEVRELRMPKWIRQPLIQPKLATQRG